MGFVPEEVEGVEILKIISNTGMEGEFSKRTLDLTLL